MMKKISLKNLFYTFYCEVLDLYTQNTPKCLISMQKHFKTENNGSKTMFSPSVCLVPNSYYWKNKKEIQELQSFKQIEEYLKSAPDILKTDGVISSSPKKEHLGKKTYQISGIGNSFGPTIFNIAEDIFEKYNKNTIQITLDLKPTPQKEIKISKKEIIERLKNRGTSPPPLPQNHYYYLQNFCLEKNFVLKINKNYIKIKTLSDDEKSLLINCRHFGPEDVSNDISSIEAAIVSKTPLNEEEIKSILAVLRIFKAGDFRLYGIGKVQKELTKTRITLNTFSNAVEKVLAAKSVHFAKKYLLTRSEIKKFQSFFKITHNEIKSFEFAIEYLGLLHATEKNHKIPIIFFILESFFPKIRSENTYRLSYCITKILKKNHEFTKTIRIFYKLRSNIVHGENKELIKLIKKIKNLEGSSCVNIEQCVDTLEMIMRNVWKKIIIEQLFKKDDIEAELF